MSSGNDGWDVIMCKLINNKFNKIFLFHTLSVYFFRFSEDLSIIAEVAREFTTSCIVHKLLQKRKSIKTDIQACKLIKKLPFHSNLAIEYEDPDYAN